MVKHKISDCTSKINPFLDKVFITTKKPGSIDISDRKKAMRDPNNDYVIQRIKQVGIWPITKEIANITSKK
jgi:hypothetical protein